MAKRKTFREKLQDDAADLADAQDHKAKTQFGALLDSMLEFARAEKKDAYSSNTYSFGKKIDEETRITDTRTGGMKGKKLAQLGAVDPAALLELAKVAGMGSEKYSRMNFMRGYAWSLSIDALFRHLLAFTNGEQNDPESGLHHMGHAAWHALALISFAERGLGTDDRYHGKD